MNKFDKLLLVLGFLIVVGIFTLAYILYVEGGLCAINPIEYAISKNLTNPEYFQRIIIP